MASDFALAHRNLFPDALPHVEHWSRGRLEARSKELWSSQALCISVFGAIACSERLEQVIADILSSAEIELQTRGAPMLECEVRDRRDVLNERGGSNPTCPDVLARWPYYGVLTVESTFTEHLGGCSQPRERELRRADGKVEKHPRACSGNFEPRSDLRTRSKAACRLMVADGRRSARLYWQTGKRVFRPEVRTPPQRPCPFSNGTYQLMRSLCFAAGLAEWEHHPMFGFLLAYVGAAPAASATAATFAEFRSLLLPQVAPMTGSITYEQISEIVADHGMVSLATWLTTRITDGLDARARVRQRR